MINYTDMKYVYPHEYHLKSDSNFIRIWKYNYSVENIEYIDELDIKLDKKYGYDLKKDIHRNSEYRVLSINGETLMDDGPIVRLSNLPFLFNAHGDVLIFGLGMGFILFPLLEKENIESVTIIENNKDVIDLISPILNNEIDSNKFVIKYGDAFTYYKNIDNKFDTIYFDIWNTVSEENQIQMNKLMNIYNKFLKSENSWVGCWYDKNEEIVKEITKLWND